MLCFENAHSKGVTEIFLEVRILKDLGFVSESKSTLADTSASADPKGLSVGSKMKKAAESCRTPISENCLRQL